MEERGEENEDMVQLVDEETINRSIDTCLSMCTTAVRIEKVRSIIKDGTDTNAPVGFQSQVLSDIFDITVAVVLRLNKGALGMPFNMAARERWVAAIKTEFKTKFHDQIFVPRSVYEKLMRGEAISPPVAIDEPQSEDDEPPPLISNIDGQE